MSGGRLLVIASYNGPRRWSYPNGFLLKLQHLQLTRLKHKLDRILVVQNESKTYPKELELFEHVVRHNLQGSYGAWRDAILMNPGYEWYFILEDDYVPCMDLWDDRIVEMWEPGVVYLASRVVKTGRWGRHASLVNGAIRGDEVRNIDWSQMKTEDIYNTQLQVEWSRCFGDWIKPMNEKYSFPYWQGGIERDGDRPVLIKPSQMCGATSVVFGNHEGAF